MSIITYISFPRCLGKLRESYIKEREEDEFSINANPSECIYFPDTSFIESEIAIFDKEDATFDNCFKNPSIYRLYLEVSDYYSEQRKEISQGYFEREDSEGYLNEETMAQLDQDLKKYWDKDSILRNQALYKFLNENLKNGEFAEIYTSWHDHVNFNFDPPTSEQTINLEDLPKLTSPTKTIELDERTKMTIIKTE